MYKLIRISTGVQGTFGCLMSPDIPIPICYTAEPPWLDNQSHVSCIPERIYAVKKYSGTKYKDVWKIQDVPGRSDILFHWGNYPVASGHKKANTEGCILVGQKLGIINNRYAVTDSLPCIHRLRTIVPDEFLLEILNTF